MIKLLTTYTYQCVSPLDARNALTLVNRNVAHDANAEKTGAVNTHTVSTDKGMFIFCANLYKHKYSRTVKNITDTTIIEKK